MCPILSYQNIATLTPVYPSPIIVLLRELEHFEVHFEVAKHGIF